VFVVHVLQAFVYVIFWLPCATC